MIKINRTKLPPVLETYHLGKGVKSYTADFVSKTSPLRSDTLDYLLNFQNNLCAYCMGPIKKENMSIEHFVSQSANPTLATNPNNFLGVCSGTYVDDDEKCVNHCDKSKKKEFKEIARLLYRDIHVHIQYDSNGTIHSRDSGDQLENELNGKKYLNLNRPRSLRENRRTVHKNIRVDIIKILQKNIPKSKKTEKMKKLFNEIERSDSPYKGVILWELNKYIKEW